MAIARKRLEIPAKVSDRPVTNRGVHLQPFGYHGTWLDNASYWVELMVSMGISWVVLLTEGDSVLEERQGTSPLKVLLDAGIIPIIRDKQQLPDGFLNLDTVKRTVALHEKYGLRPFWQLYNEPFDHREWKHGKVPPYEEAWQIIVSRWTEGASQAAQAGAYVGFPDGPGYDENPFERLRPVGGLDLFDSGVAFYAPHCYGKCRPLWYPYDAVTRHGAELTEEAYKRMLDDYQDDPAWYDAPVELLNQQRHEWQDPDRTAIDDDTCWRGWEKIVSWALESLGYVPPMAMTEGGWAPRDRAGSAPIDIRWPHSTPNMVAKKTLQMYDTPSPIFAICPWLLADRDMGGADGWAFDAWHGWAYNDKYGNQKPVIDTLRRMPPKELELRARPMVLDLNGDTRDWVWIEQTFGAGYRRGETPLRLIEVHEYEGPASLDALVVDGDGLPLEGVEFYCYHPDAPELEADEWLGQGTLSVTGADGRVSFPLLGEPCAAGACKGALWPKGRGDLLDGIGLLEGTRNRHLNGVWQLLEPGIPLPQEPTDEPIAVAVEDEPDVEPGDQPQASEPAADRDETGRPTIDPRIAALLSLELGAHTYQVQQIEWMDPDESDGLHHIFVDVVDEQGRRLAGEKLRVSWSDGEAVVPIEEKPGEPWGGNYPMYATLGSYEIRVVSAGESSDAIGGLGMGTPEDPNTKHHTSFGLRFVKRAVVGAPPSSGKPEAGGVTPPDKKLQTEPQKPKPADKPKAGPAHPAKPDSGAGPQIDARIQALVALDLTGDLYKLEEITWMDPDESKGLHHIFVDLVDQEGRRLAGEKFRVSWSEEEVIVPVEEKPGEPWGGNYPMYTTMGSYSVHIVSPSGASDVVMGLGMGTPEEPQIKHHTSFGLRFRKVS